MKREGYFIGLPLLIQDNVGGNNITTNLHTGYWFVDKRHVLNLVLRSEDALIRLSKSQFVGSITICHYIVESNILKIINNYDTKFEVIQEFNIVSENVFKGKENTFSFRSWECV